MKAKPGMAEKVWKSFQQCDEAIGAWVVTGDWDVIAWVDAYSWDGVYDLVAKMRKENWIESSSSHWVHHGHKNGSWWWDWPAGAWVLWRDNKLNGSWKKTTNWKWAVSSASVPGDWDWVTWVGGKNWNEVWNHVLDFQKPGWQTTTLVPVRSWWNKSWAKNWWG